MLGSHNLTTPRHRGVGGLFSGSEAGGGGGSEASPLLQQPYSRSSPTITNEERPHYGLTSSFQSFLRLFVLLLLAFSCTGVGILFQIELNHLTDQLHTEHDKTEQLQALLQQHEAVIERFNSSITNSDVMNQLATLKHELRQTSTDLRTELAIVQADVSLQLNETVDELSQTVQDAEQQISSEVDRVKKDVEQYVIATQDQFSMENSFMVYQLAGTFTLLSCLMSMWHMTAHLRKMHQPDVQRRILAILWMVPIYAITSWFSLVFHSAEGYLAIVKDGYEAYVIYQFLSFCIAVLGKGDRNTVVDLLAKRADHLTPPFRLLGFLEVCGILQPPVYENNRAYADAVLLQCQAFAMQFVFFRPLTTTAMVLLKKFDYYGPSHSTADFRSPQFYLIIIQNVSIFTAFTGLLKFYHAVDQDLAWCRPFAKFLCIKCVVFMTFWQGLAIAILAQTTDVVGNATADEWAQAAQNFLICLEMLLFSIAHMYCFPTEEWEEGYRVKRTQAGLMDSIALGDFLTDLKLILRKSGRQGRKKKQRKNEPPMIPEEPEEEDEYSETNDDSETYDGESYISEATDALSSITSEFHGRTPTKTSPTQPPLDQVHDPRRSLHELDDEQKIIARALEESLGTAGNDPDIEEAKHRLLASKILSPEMFFGGSDDDDDYSDEDDDHQKNKDNDNNVGDDDDDDDKKHHRRSRRLRRRISDQAIEEFLDKATTSEDDHPTDDKNVSVDEGETFHEAKEGVDDHEEEKEEVDQKKQEAKKTESVAASKTATTTTPAAILPEDDPPLYDQFRGVYSSMSYHEDTPMDTSFLSPSSTQQLRPSIFTAIASFADSESDHEAKKEAHGPTSSSSS